MTKPSAKREFRGDPMVSAILQEQIEDQSGRMESALLLSDEQKVEVLLTLLATFHKSIDAWHTRAFTGVTWGVGLKFAAVSSVYVYLESASFSVYIVIAIGIIAFSLMIQLYLLRARRAFHGNRRGIAKCEAGLGLYRANEYLEGRSFFTFATSMMTSRSLRVLTRVHLLLAAISVGMVLLGGIVTSPNESDIPGQDNAERVQKHDPLRISHPPEHAGQTTASFGGWSTILERKKKPIIGPSRGGGDGGRFGRFENGSKR